MFWLGPHLQLEHSVEWNGKKLGAKAAKSSDLIQR